MYPALLHHFNLTGFSLARISVNAFPIYARLMADRIKFISSSWILNHDIYGGSRDHTHTPHVLYLEHYWLDEGGQWEQDIIPVKFIENNNTDNNYNSFFVRHMMYEDNNSCVDKYYAWPKWAFVEIVLVLEYIMKHEIGNSQSRACFGWLFIMQMKNERFEQCRLFAICCIWWDENLARMSP